MYSIHNSFTKTTELTWFERRNTSDWKCRFPPVYRGHYHRSTRRPTVQYLHTHNQ